ncbi:hypothetical protein DL767_009196 [Monosporascus sp. MG133]|nr:hypothetical protein DL767_009196 [Monosporascus sp. MG133]
MLSELLVSELMAKAADRGVPFQLDVALAHITPYLRRLRGIRDQRPIVRELVERFAKAFHDRQPCQPQPEQTPQAADGALCRLRVLTSKRVPFKPPYLQTEKRPRFVARYDSWHPQRFVPEAHLPSVDYSDSDISSEDEDVAVAFSTDSPDGVMSNISNFAD